MGTAFKDPTVYAIPIDTGAASGYGRPPRSRPGNATVRAEGASAGYYELERAGTGDAGRRGQGVGGRASISSPSTPGASYGAAPANGDYGAPLTTPTYADNGDYGAPLTTPTYADYGAPLTTPTNADYGAPLTTPTYADYGAPLTTPTDTAAAFAYDHASGYHVPGRRPPAGTGGAGGNVHYGRHGGARASPDARRSGDGHQGVVERARGQVVGDVQASIGYGRAGARLVRPPQGRGRGQHGNVRAAKRPGRGGAGAAKGPGKGPGKGKKPPRDRSGVRWTGEAGGGGRVRGAEGSLKGFARQGSVQLRGFDDSEIDS